MRLGIGRAVRTINAVLHDVENSPGLSRVVSKWRARAGIKL